MIKTSMLISVLKTGANSPILFSGDNEENFQTIKELGFDGVDLFINSEDDSEVKKTIRLCEKYDFPINSIMPTFLVKNKIFLGDKDEDARKKSVLGVIETAKLANDLNSAVCLGMARGKCGENDNLDNFKSRLATSFYEILDKIDTKIHLEPINRYQTNVLNSTLESVEFIKENKLPIYLALDTFHMNIEDLDLHESFVKAKPYIGSIHFSDSTRLAPSTAHTGMKNLFHLLKGMEYDGYLTLEAFPKPSNLECAKNAREFFRKMNNIYS